MKRQHFLGGALAVAFAPLLGKFKVPEAMADPRAVNAWPEGAKHPAYPAGESVGYKREDAGWSMFRRRHARKYPLLALALRERERANSTHIYWLESVRDSTGRWGRIMRSNNQQIMRVARELSGGEGVEKARAFHHLCSDIEWCLRHGAKYGVNENEPVYDEYPFATMAGARALLGRDPQPGDMFRLRPLRDPFWRVTTYPDGKVMGEWITEVSLMASAGLQGPK